MGSVLRTNEVTNPSFETGTTGWETSATATVDDFSASTGWSEVGNQAAHCKATGTGASQTFVIRDDANLSVLSVDASTDYALRVRVNVLTVPDANGPGAYLDWKAAGGGFLRRDLIEPNAGTGEFTLSTQVTSPATAATVRINIGHSSVFVAENRLDNGEVSEFYADAVLFEQASSVGVYFDGDSVETDREAIVLGGVGGGLHVNGKQYDWTGTAHESTSQESSADWQLTELDLTPAPMKGELISSPASDGAVEPDEPHYANATDQILKVAGIPQASRAAAEDIVGTLADWLAEAGARRDQGGLECHWQPSGGSRKWAFDMVRAQIVDRPIKVQGDDAGYFAYAPVVTVSFERLPAFRSLTESNVAAVSGSDPILTIEVPDVGGDLPALGRLVITDTAGETREHFEWGREWRHYDSGSPWDLLIDSDDLDASSYAGSGNTRSGAYDPNAAGNSVIRAELATDPVTVTGKASLPHIGRFRAKARVYASASGVEVRASYRTGDAPLAYTRQGFIEALDSRWCELDLGEVIFEELDGTQSSEIRIEAQGEDGGETLDVDYLTLTPLEASGILRAPVDRPAPTAFTARDEFNQTTGDITGKSLPSGQTWAGDGDGNDFGVNATSSLIRRSATSDTSGTGRLIVPDAGAITGQLCHVAMRRSEATWDLADVDVQGFMPRYSGTFGTDEDGLRIAYDNGTGFIFVDLYEAGSATTLTSISQTQGAPDPLDSKWVRFLALVTADGRWWFWAAQGKDGVFGGSLKSGQDSVLATGGAAASGRLALYDEKPGSGAGNRDFDDYWIAPVTLDAVCHASQSLEITAEEIRREDSTGSFWGRPPVRQSARLFIPPEGPDERTTRIMTKLRRWDVGDAQGPAQPDDYVSDPHSARVYWYERSIVVPRS